MTRIWSPYQGNIFSHVETPGSRNAIIKAVAGSGKSTTIAEAANRVIGSHIMLAFNKAIAEELKEKGVNARTFHSVCYTPVTRARGVSSVETNKMRMLVDKYMEKNDGFIYGAFICRLVGIAKGAGVGCLVPDTPSYWYDAIDYHSLELENEGANLERAVELASWLLEASNASQMCDFDDLLYFAVKDNIALTKYQNVFVDEAQDTNMIQRSILKKIMLPGSRLIAVGDPAQAIYGFRGADSNSLDYIARDFDCIELPLTVSYRCGNNIVKEAQKWVKHIEAAPGAPDGEVVDMDKKWHVDQFSQLDLVVCRTTKPLVSLAYKLMRSHIPVMIMGKDIGAGLMSLIKRQKCDDLDALVLKLDNWAAREVAAALLKHQEAKAEAQQDKVDAIKCLIDTLGEHERTVPALLDIISRLFSDRKDANILKLATIHKAKGMEADTVWWLNSRACPAKWAKREWQQEQERNLCYVAITRAKTRLNLIEDSGTGGSFRPVVEEVEANTGEE